MSSAIANPTNVVEYIRSLSDEDKETAFAELVEEVIRSHGGNFTIPIMKSNAEVLAYLVPEAVAVHQMRVTLPKRTPEQLAEIQAAIDDIDNTFDVEEYFEELSRKDQD